MRSGRAKYFLIFRLNPGPHLSILSEQGSFVNSGQTAGWFRLKFCFEDLRFGLVASK
jgi:hypothetical protein